MPLLPDDRFDRIQFALNDFKCEGREQLCPLKEEFENGFTLYS